MEDEKLVEQILAGNHEAYRELVDRHKAYIFSLIYRMVGHRETAEDLSQEVFIKLYRSLSGFRGEAKFTTWLYRLTYNAVTDYRRSQKRKPYETILDKVKGWFGQEKEEPEFALLEKEEHETLYRALAMLPDKYRIILYLYHYKQWSYQEISKTTGLPLKTVETRLYRGKTMLKQKWQEANPHESKACNRSKDNGVYEQNLLR